MQFAYVYEIDDLLSQKKSILLEKFNWHWCFIHCLVWDSRQNRSFKRSNANFFSQQVGSRQTHSFLVFKSSTIDNRRKAISIPQISSNRDDIDSDFESQSHELPTEIQEQYTSLFLLDSRFQPIQDPIIVKLCGRPLDLLNKKRSRRDIAFERSTCRDPSLFKHRKRRFLASQQQ